MQGTASDKHWGEKAWVLQATNAGVRRPGYEANWMYCFKI